MKLKKVSNSYGVIVGLLAGLIAIQFFIKYKTGTENEILSYVILGIALLSALFKSVASGIASIWMAFGMLLGRINGAILLTLVYFLILTPLSWLKKLFSPSDVFTKSKGKDSRFIMRDHVYSKGDIQYPW